MISHGPKCGGIHLLIPNPNPDPDPAPEPEPSPFPPEPFPPPIPPQPMRPPIPQLHDGTGGSVALFKSRWR
jgi:hypothetical protein